MTNTALVFATVKTSLAELSRHTAALADGLYHAAPAKNAALAMEDTENKSIKYLVYISKTINKHLEKCETSPTQSNEKKLEL